MLLHVGARDRSARLRDLDVAGLAPCTAPPAATQPVKRHDPAALQVEHVLAPARAAGDRHADETGRRWWMIHATGERATRPARERDIGVRSPSAGDHVGDQMRRVLARRLPLLLQISASMSSPPRRFRCRWTGSAQCGQATQPLGRHRVRGKENMRPMTWMPVSAPRHVPVGYQSPSERRAEHDRTKVRHYTKRRWQHLRNAYRATHPLCECGCSAVATVVDHKRPHSRRSRSTNAPRPRRRVGREGRRLPASGSRKVGG